MTNNLAFSATRLMTYEDCPFMFYKRVILGEDTGDSLPLNLGSATHFSIEHILKGVPKYEAIMQGYMKYQMDGLDIKDIVRFVENAP